MDDKIYITNRTRNLILAVLAAIFIAHSVYSLIRETAWINRVYPGFWILKNTSVAGAFYNDLVGYKKGIKIFDVVLEVDGRPFNDGIDILNYVSKQKPGAEIVYLVKNRAGQTRTVTVPAQLMTLSGYMNYFFFPKINGFLFFLIALLTFYLRPNSRQIWIFLFSGVIIGFTLESVMDYRVNEFNLTMYFLPMLAPAMGLIGFYFPAEAKHRRLAAILMAITTIPVIPLFAYSLRSAPFYLFMTYVAVANNGIWCSIGVLTMARSFARSNDVSVRKRGKIGVYGFLLTAACVGSSQLGDYFGGSTMISFYLFRISILILPASLAYAIVVHNIFDVDQVIRRTLIYLLVTGIVIGIFIMLVISFSLLLQNVTGYSSRIAEILSTILIMILFRPLRDRVEGIIDRRFNREKYEYQTTIREANEVLATIIDLGELLDHILSTVMNAIKITRGAVFIREKDAGRFMAAVSRGYENPGGIEPIPYTHPLMTQLEEFRRGLQINDIEQLGAFREHREPMLELMRLLKFVVVVPIMYERRLIGILGLGEKMTGAWYSTEDIALLRTLMIQTAVSIENARKVEDLKKMVELETSYRELQRLDELKNNFLSMVSHDLRTPMTSIKGYASILMEKIDKYEKERQLKYLSIIVKESDRLTRLINDLLDLQRFEAGKMQMILEDVNLTELVKTSGDSFGGAALSKRITLKHDIPAEEYFVKGDRDRLAQVIANLMSNAIKFTPDGGWVNVGMEKSNENGKPTVKVSVSDSGPGIPKDKQDGLFNKFQQVESMIRSKEQGSGLGLALVREIVEHHRGRVGLVSEPGKGSVFYFTIQSV